ncbi:urease accessory protein UreE [Litchfieldella xinjiangensis]|uniref:urease accessory protein UreE n=1 Tax=Litchfieldella xinjiangensis TaxID=1166948 RepID=UPI0005BAEC45|nr:urease accessory protein UreE [Halomonas xinjiangensis]
MLKLIERLEAQSDIMPDDTLTLPFELRIRGRLKAQSDSGRELGLFLDRGPVLRDGSLLRAESGEIVRINSAVEPVATAWTAPGLPLARLAYHLGNRHVQLALGENEVNGERRGWVRFPPDHVLEELAELLGARIEHHEEPFDPEPGAYTQLGHSHAHDHGHAHDHPHEHDHAH